jgi:hypothetical protein
MMTMSREPCSDTLRRTAAYVATLAAIAMLPGSPAQAGGVSTTNCINGWDGATSCVEVWRDGLRDPFVVSVPPPTSPQDVADTATRERLWQARCRPVVRQDMYGVRRYHYSAPGCEYGKYE